MSRLLRIALMLFIALTVMSCGGSDGPTEVAQPGSSTPTTTIEEAASAAPTTTPTSSTELAPTTTDTSTSTTAPEPLLEELEMFVDQTVQQPRMDYVSSSTSTLAGGEVDNVMIRSGWFDDDSWSGEGTMTITSSEPSVPSIDEPFTFRLVDDEYWTFNPLADPATWTGWDVHDFMVLIGGDPTASMDGDLALLAVLGAAVEVVEVEVTRDNTERWELDVRADDLLPVFSLAGAAQRLADAGAADTGIIETAFITVQDGLVIEVAADLSTWWTEVQTITFEQEGFDLPESPDQAMWTLTLTPFDEVRTVERPCIDTEVVTEDGVDLLVC